MSARVIAIVLDEELRPVVTLDPADSCTPHIDPSKPEDRCGGCGECMLQIASSYRVEFVELAEHDTEGDAIGRRLREIGGKPWT